MKDIKMPNDEEAKISLKKIVEYVVCVGLIALFGFLWNVNRKVNDISDNKKSIGKLWMKYGEMSQELKAIHKDVGRLEGRHIE